MLFFKSKPKPSSDDPFFVWFPADHSVGIARFDQDHKRLTDILNRIHETLNEDRDRNRAAKLMEHLIQEIRSHFHQEEAALTEASYPDLENHMAEHQQLLEEANSLLRQFLAGTISGMAFPIFIKNWLIGHMKDSDRKYSACLRRQGER
ncbi:MAG: bacteriohemerythrin [Holophaga sp.]|nr:bacteriohemerythrin [Holophaga sp.]